MATYDKTKTDSTTFTPAVDDVYPEGALADDTGWDSYTPTISNGEVGAPRMTTERFLTTAPATRNDLQDTLPPANYQPSRIAVDKHGMVQIALYNPEAGFIGDKLTCNTQGDRLLALNGNKTQTFAVGAVGDVSLDLLAHSHSIVSVHLDSGDYIATLEFLASNQSSGARAVPVYAYPTIGPPVTSVTVDGRRGTQQAESKVVAVGSWQIPMSGFDSFILRVASLSGSGLSGYLVATDAPGLLTQRTILSDANGDFISREHPLDVLPTGTTATRDREQYEKTDQILTALAWILSEDTFKSRTPSPISTVSTLQSFNVTTTPILIAPLNVSRKSIIITNNSATTGINLGKDNSVTSSGTNSGLLIPAGGSYTDSLPGVSIEPIWAVSGGSVRVVVSDRS